MYVMEYAVSKAPNPQTRPRLVYVSFCKLIMAHAQFVWCLNQAVERTRKRRRSKRVLRCG